MLPEPPERFGWRRWLACPRSTWEAWRIDVRGRLSPGAADLVARAEVAAAARAAAKAQRRTTTDRDRTRREVIRLARVAAQRAAKRGESGPALVTLLALARAGEPPADQPALPRVPAHESAPVEPAHGEPPALPSCEPVRGEPGDPSEPVPVRPRRKPAHEPGAGEPRRLTAAADRPRRSVVTSSTGSTETRLAAAHAELVDELGRTPSGPELAARAQVSKATANRWKSEHKTEEQP